MANVFDTAKYILEKSGKMSTMKLQKLCYYSQAWALVWDDAPLFDEDFQAWAMDRYVRNYFSRQRECILSVQKMKPVGKRILQITKKIQLAKYWNIMEAMMHSG